MTGATATADQDLLLDLLNSTPIVAGAQRDLLADDGRGWTRARGGIGSPSEIAHLRRVRRGMQAVVRGVAAPEVLSPLLAGVRLAPEVDASGLVWRLAVQEEELLAARALRAWGEVQKSMPGRLRACGNPECRHFLLDRSRPNTARWCSMKTCGNRLKARRHYERVRRDDARRIHE